MEKGLDGPSTGEDVTARARADTASPEMRSGIQCIGYHVCRPSTRAIQSFIDGRLAAVFDVDFICFDQRRRSVLGRRGE